MHRSSGFVSGLKCTTVAGDSLNLMIIIFGMRLSIQNSHCLVNYPAIEECRLLVSLLFECNFSVLIESQERQDENLIIDQCTKD